MTVSGNLTINIGTTGGGLFVSRSTPNHAINVGGIWRNNRASSFTAGYSTVTFDGTASSAITGSQPTAFYTLNLGTTLGSGESKTINIGHITAGSALTTTATNINIGSISQTTGITTVNLGNNGSVNNTVAQTLTVSGNLTINGAVSGGGGGSLVSVSTPAHVINIGGNWTNNRTFSAGFSTVTFYNATSSNISGTADTAFNTLNLGSSLGAAISKTINIGHSSVDGSLTITAATLTIGSTAQTTGITTVNLGNNGATDNTAAQTLTVTGNLTINIGTTGGGLFVSRSTPSHAVNVGGYWTNNRAASFTAGYSTVTFNTAAISRITGTQATTFYNLACVTPE